MSELVEDAVSVLGSAGFFPGNAERRRAAVLAAIDAGHSAEDLTVLAQFALRTQAPSGAFLGLCFSGRSDLGDAISCAKAAQSQDGLAETKKRELDIRERELRFKEKAAEPEPDPPYWKPAPDPMTRVGRDPTNSQHILDAFDDGSLPVDWLEHFCRPSTGESVLDLLRRERDYDGPKCREGESESAALRREAAERYNVWDGGAQRRWIKEMRAKYGHRD